MGNWPITRFKLGTNDWKPNNSLISFMVYAIGMYHYFVIRNRMSSKHIALLRRPANNMVMKDFHTKNFFFYPIFYFQILNTIPKN